MKTVYITTDGDYSDYHITGVFSTEELAKEYIVKAESGEITNWGVDENADLIIGSAFTSEIDIVTGAINRKNPVRILIHPNERVPNNQYIPQVREHKGVYLVYRNYFRESYVSQEHADKLVVELRQDLLRRWGGVTNINPKDGYWVTLINPPSE